jgi:hypothetical protein
MTELDATDLGREDSPYVQAAFEAGAWLCHLQLPDVPVEDVRAALLHLTRSTGWPVAAFLYGEDGPVSELTLYRDPSRSHGTPALSECVAGLRALVEDTGWSLAPVREPDDWVVVGLGLREGYEPGAVEHDPDYVTARLGPGAECRMARLVSARVVDGVERWYSEVGVVVRAERDLLPTIGAVAAVMAQDRFVVTDPGGLRTVAFKLHR